jgi:para-nitrobenzyl esterase
LSAAEPSAAEGGTVYLYELTYSAPGAAFGACHGLDVPLLFGSFGAAGHEFGALALTA